MQQASGASNDTQLPRAVLRRSAAINARVDARNGKQPEPAVPATPQPTPASVAEPTPPGPVANAEPAPPVATPTPPDPRENDPVYWRNRFKTVEGTLKAARDAWRMERERLTQELTQLQEQIRSLQAAAPAAKIDLTTLFTAEQIEKFGEDQLQTVATAAQKAARGEAQALIEKEVKPLREQSQARQEQVAEDRQTEYLETLADLVPDYVDIDATEEWKLWLVEEDEETGVPRQQILTHHHTRMDAKKVAKVFDRYKRSSAAALTPPAPPVAPHGDGKPGASAVPESRESLTVPTEAEIRDFTRRSATLRKGQKGFVTEEERKLFDKRLELKFTANRRR